MSSFLSNPSDLVIERLEALADAICGEEEIRYIGSEDRVRHALDRIVKQYQSTGSLPTVTASDNGKVLMVVEGEWAAVDPDAAP